MKSVVEEVWAQLFPAFSVYVSMSVYLASGSGGDVSVALGGVGLHGLLWK